MEAVWSNDWPEFSVADVHLELGESREIAYTTVMTTVTRLHEKGALELELARSRVATTQAEVTITEAALRVMVAPELRELPALEGTLNTETPAGLSSLLAQARVREVALSGRRAVQHAERARSRSRRAWIQAPMATVILFGLVSSTILNMVVVPPLLLRFGGGERDAVDQRPPLPES